MENNQTFLVPSNFKKSRLIFGAFKVVDLIYFFVGLAITIVMFILTDGKGLKMNIMSLIPLITVSILITPIPNYHNIIYFIQRLVHFYFLSKRNYKWTGWNYKEELMNE